MWTITWWNTKDDRFTVDAWTADWACGRGIKKKYITVEMETDCTAWLSAICKHVCYVPCKSGRKTKNKTNSLIAFVSVVYCQNLVKKSNLKWGDGIRDIYQEFISGNQGNVSVLKVLLEQHAQMNVYACIVYTSMWAPVGSIWNYGFNSKLSAQVTG